MRKPTILLALLSASLGVAQTSCNQVECSEGTIERDGMCVASSNNYDPAMCGPFTMLQGDQCVPEFPPTVCEDGTTLPETDPDTGVTTCKGTGTTAGCGASLACPAGSGTNKLTVCGQIYDFANGAKFEAADADGTRCDPANPAQTGPCALQIVAYDAVDFGDPPVGGPTPLPISEVLIDNCGRFRLKDIDTSSSLSPFIGIGFDDANMELGPDGVTVTVGIATSKPSERYVKDVEGYIANKTLVGMWAASGFTTFGTTGAYAPIFRKHPAGKPNPFETQSGVTVVRNGNPVPANDFYFRAADVDRTTIDPDATATGVNGTALYTGASVTESLIYSGSGGTGAGCRWEPHAAASLPGLLFVQVFRKIDAVTGGPCND
jgi:hypothetical protein